MNLDSKTTTAGVKSYQMPDINRSDFRTCLVSQRIETGVDIIWPRVIQSKAANRVLSKADDYIFKPSRARYRAD